MTTAAESAHSIAVAAWSEHLASADSVGSLVQTFEDTFSSLWRRSQLVLGEVTLTAIVDRVLYTAVERYPVLASLEVDAAGLRCRNLRAQAGLRREEVSAAVCFLLVDFLTVLGSLTAEILTPSLHSELTKAQTSARDRSITEDEAP